METKTIAGEEESSQIQRVYRGKLGRDEARNKRFSREQSKKNPEKSHIKKGTRKKYPKKTEYEKIPKMVRKLTMKEKQKRDLDADPKDQNQKRDHLEKLNEDLKKEKANLKKKQHQKKVNFGRDERRWTYDTYWIIRKRIILGICFKHISSGSLRYMSVRDEISKKLNDFNELVKLHPEVQQHFDDEDESWMEEFESIQAEVFKYETVITTLRKKIKDLKEKKGPLGDVLEFEEEVRNMRNDRGAAKLRNKFHKMAEEKDHKDALQQLDNGEITQERFDDMGFNLKQKKTMFDWVRFPPKGELRKVEKELMQGILKDGSKVLNFKGHGLVDLKKKYFHGPKVHNDSDILKDLDVDAFFKEESEGEIKQGGRRRTRRKRRTRRNVRKKGTKKKALRRRTRRKTKRKRRRKRRTRKKK